MPWKKSETDGTDNRVCAQELELSAVYQEYGTGPYRSPCAPVLNELTAAPTMQKAILKVRLKQPIYLGLCPKVLPMS
jgi:hypothetical protein